MKPTMLVPLLVFTLDVSGVSGASCFLLWRQNGAGEDNVPFRWNSGNHGII